MAAATILALTACDPVSERSLLDYEHLWPYRVELVGPWAPEGGAQPLAAGSTGVLIRVQSNGLARIDFGRDGLYEVPVSETDLVEGARRIRRGELEKLEPNFVAAIGARLIDPAADSLRPFPPEALAGHRAFLCVFADPGAEDFVELAAALEPLASREGLLTILFPQGSSMSDAALYKRLRALEWTAPFMFGHLSKAYTRTLLDPSTALPVAQLNTEEGRLLWQGGFTPELVPHLTAALEQADRS